MSSQDLRERVRLAVYEAGATHDTAEYAADAVLALLSDSSVPGERERRGKELEAALWGVSSYLHDILTNAKLPKGWFDAALRSHNYARRVLTASPTQQVGERERQLSEALGGVVKAYDTEDKDMVSAGKKWKKAMDRARRVLSASPTGEAHPTEREKLLAEGHALLDSWDTGRP